MKFYPSPRLRHFAPSEFGAWVDRIDPRLLFRLEAWREAYGEPIIISAAPGAIGREWGSPKSRHYAVSRAPDAIDLFIPGDLERALVTAMTMAGGLGLYAGWTLRGKPLPGIHFDARPRPPAGPETWGKIEGEWTTIGAAARHYGIAIL